MTGRPPPFFVDLQMSPSLTLHFTRNANSSNDDIIKINKGADGVSLLVSMYDAIIGKKYITQVPKESLHAYVNSLLTLSKYDVEPFIRVQISAPYYPCFIFATSDLTNSKILSSIDSLLDVCLSTWYPYDGNDEDEIPPRNQCYCEY